VLSNVSCSDDEIEMHHGPLLTLYDIVSVVLNHYIKNDLPFLWEDGGNVQFSETPSEEKFEMLSPHQTSR
jgi:hypothetical protein